MNRPSNLPPGVTDRMIEEQAGGDLHASEEIQAVARGDIRRSRMPTALPPLTALWARHAMIQRPDGRRVLTPPEGLAVAGLGTSRRRRSSPSSRLDRYAGLTLLALGAFAGVAWLWAVFSH